MSDEQPDQLPHGEVTRILQRLAHGDPAARDDLAEAAYPRLLRIADSELRARYGSDLAGVTIEPAILVNDVLLRVLGDPRSFENRRHFYSFAARMLVNLLIDYERSRRAKKRGGHLARVTLTGVGSAGSQPTVGLSRLSEVLASLEAIDPRKSEVVQLRVFFGLELREIAELLDVSPSTIDRDWRFARRWLAAQLTIDEGRSSGAGAAG